MMRNYRPRKNTNNNNIIKILLSLLSYHPPFLHPTNVSKDNTIFQVQ